MLRVDWATHKAARYACLYFHYSKSVPVGKLVKIGIWEHDEFIGVVLYGRGAAHALLKPYGLTQTEGCELVRIALKKHVTPVSKIMAISFKLLKTINPNMRLIVSFADPSEGHHGGIYQATNWVYTGQTEPTYEFIHKGKRLMRRAYTGINFDGHRLKLPEGAVKKDVLGKHRYLMPLDKKMRKQIISLSKPYPKRGASDTIDTPSFQMESAGKN